jgi:hypothetical protein
LSDKGSRPIPSRYCCSFKLLGDAVCVDWLLVNTPLSSCITVSLVPSSVVGVTSFSSLTARTLKSLSLRRIISRTLLPICRITAGIHHSAVKYIPIFVTIRWMSCLPSRSHVFNSSACGLAAELARASRCKERSLSCSQAQIDDLDTNSCVGILTIA